jgi:hypothetical protein
MWLIDENIIAHNTDHLKRIQYRAVDEDEWAVAAVDLHNEESIILSVQGDEDLVSGFLYHLTRVLAGGDEKRIDVEREFSRFVENREALIQDLIHMVETGDHDDL